MGLFDDDQPWSFAGFPNRVVAFDLKGEFANFELLALSLFAALSSHSYFDITMVFHPGWKPSLDGVELAPCELVTHLEADVIIPRFSIPEQRLWSHQLLESALDSYGESKPAAVDCVVSLWRLSYEEEAGRFEPLWQSHVVAWLVSSRV